MGREKGWNTPNDMPQKLSSKSKEKDLVFWGGHVCVVQLVTKNERGRPRVFLRYLGNTPPGKMATWAVDL
jgi:hypothetical protein